MRNRLPSFLFFNCIGYGEDSRIVYVRIFNFVAASIVIVCFMLFIPGKEVPVITHVGRNSMTVYIFHAFLMRLYPMQDFIIHLPMQMISVVVAAAGCTIVFSSKALTKMFSFLFQWPFAGKR